MMGYALIGIVLSLYAAPLFADLKPLLFAGYEVENGDFEGSSNAPIVGLGLRDLRNPDGDGDVAGLLDTRGDKAVGGIWYFDLGVEIATHLPILETLSAQYRLNTLPAADIHRLFVGFGF